MSRIIHFEIPAAEPDRAAAFYGKVFGWKFDKWPGPTDYWMITTGKESAPGINGGMMKKPGGITSTTNTIGVDSLDSPESWRKKHHAQNADSDGGLLRVLRRYRRQCFRRDASRSQCEVKLSLQKLGFEKLGLPTLR
jgi:catechol 2,3-dioxygenase-like lactoylglutathione lyase family enzyme